METNMTTVTATHTGDCESYRPRRSYYHPN